jgi:hypothetical protein
MRSFIENGLYGGVLPLKMLLFDIMFPGMKSPGGQVLENFTNLE